MALTHISGVTSKLVTTGPGFLQGLFFNTPVAGAVTVYDGTDNTGAVLGVFTFAASAAPLPIPLMNWPFKTGLFVSCPSGSDLTVTTS